MIAGKVQTQLFTDPQYLGGVFVEIEQALKNADYSGVMTDAIEPLEAGEKTAFDGRKTPGGTPWAPNAPSTIKRKGHGIQLFETGRLGSSLFGRTSDSIRDVYPHGLTFGTGVPYSIFNQEGTRRIPQREHVGMGEVTCQKIVDLVADQAVEFMKG